MIEAITFTALLMVAAGLVVQAARLIIREFIPVLRQYKIVRREDA